MGTDEPPVPLPITGELDLHTFRPGDVGRLIPAYLAECQARGIFSVRIVHGKGTGALRETVQALLRRLPLVHSFRLGDETSGGWGATIVNLRLPKS
jgi:dsDNA-specific endonuclease/ATPase MutS2